MFKKRDFECRKNQRKFEYYKRWRNKVGEVKVDIDKVWKNKTGELGY